MKDHYEEKGTHNELIIANISSLTLLLSAVFVLGALCRFLKRCWKKIRGKPERKHDVILFQPIATPLRKCTSTPQLATMDRFGSDNLPFATEKVAIQPESSHRLQPPLLYRTVSAIDGKRMPGYTGVASTPSPLGTRRSLPVWRPHADITPFELEPSLYKKEAALQKFQASCDRKSGTIDIEVFFDSKARKFQVKIMNVRQIMTKGHLPATNTYVTVRKLPDRNIQRTSIHTQCKNPEFNNLFTFQVEPDDDVTSHVLIFEVHHVDRFSTSVSRGIARLPLFQVDVTSHRNLTIPFSTIQKSFLSSFHPAYRSAVEGTLLLTLKYLPENELIVVNPVKVCNIPRKKHGTYDKDVYLKVVLRHRGTKIVKHKSGKRQLERTPRNGSFYETTFDEPFNLNIESIPPEESEIIISLNHYLFLKSSFIIGQIRISGAEPGYESTHLQAILDSPNEPISTWYEMRGFITHSSGE